MKNSPIIGLAPLWDDGKQCVWMEQDYLEAITLAGGMPIILPLVQNEAMIEEIASKIDGLFLTGGDDINPNIYHEKATDLCGKMCDSRDRFELKLVEKIIEQNKPIFGVCRGLQLLNVFFKGTLFQDIPTQYKKDRNFSHRQQIPYDQPVHEVFFVEGGLLAQWLNVNTLQVNSRHHQGIKKLGEGLMVEALSSDGLIEAIHHSNYPFLVAVQWHPESRCKTNEQERMLFEQFVNSCKRT